MEEIEEYEEYEKFRGMLARDMWSWFQRTLRVSPRRLTKRQASGILKRLAKGESVSGLKGEKLKNATSQARKFFSTKGSAKRSWNKLKPFEAMQELQPVVERWKTGTRKVLRDRKGRFM